MGSTRLPGKSMMDLAGKPLIYRILERVIRCKMPDKVILAIPDTFENNSLIDVAKSLGVTVFSGSENDVLERYYQAALLTGADLVCRIPADNATPEPIEIDKIIKHHISLGRPGFSSNLAEIHSSGYPDGIGSEVFDFTLLEHARNRQKDPFKREHPHLNFYDYDTGLAVDSLWCPVSSISCPAQYSRPDLILDVNTKDQYDFIRSLYDYIYPSNPQFSIIDIIEWYDNIYKKEKV